MDNFETNLYKILGKDGVFKKNLANNDFELEFGKLMKVSYINSHFTYFNQNGNLFDSFIPLDFGETNKVEYVTKEDSSKIIKDNNVSDEEFGKLVAEALAKNTTNDMSKDAATQELKETHLSSDIQSMISHFGYLKPNRSYLSEFPAHPMSKYLGKFGIVYNDSDVEKRVDGSIKGINGYGLRLVLLTGLKQVGNKIKFQSSSKLKNFYYYRTFDHFRPLTKEELENVRLGIGYNDTDKKACPRLSTFRYKVDKKYKAILYKCSALSYERTYDEFVTLKDLGTVLPLAVED